MKLTDLDVHYDFRQDAAGKDPDAHSKTLREYHQALWSRRLPSGDLFDLDVETRGEYLHHKSALGEFFLSSDAVVPTMHYWERVKPILIDFTDDEIDEFERITYTIGGVIIFPSNRVGDHQTINMARGRNRSIEDRFDLTLECIRRHYSGLESPLSTSLDDYSAFFSLFDDYRGYVDFFFLQDLVTEDYSSIKWWMPFDEFARPAYPTSADEYRGYRDRCVAWIEARNRRIDTFCQGESQSSAR